MTSGDPDAMDRGVVFQPWYREGLRFECTRCGHCCGGGPGTVRVSDAEIEALARHLGLSEEEFRGRYTRLFRRDLIILQEKPNHDCVFFAGESGCQVYPVRPRQCRTWPFWEVNLRSPQSWEDAARGCPGIHRGPLHSAELISAASRDDGTCGSALRATA